MSAHPIRVLLVEDNPGDARLVELALAESPNEAFDVSTMNRLSHALDSLSRTQYDVVLLDLTLPDCPPHATVEHVAAAAPLLPIVVLTGYEDELFSRDVVKHGAQDYLVKGQFDSRLLARSLCYAIERKKTQLELAHARDAVIEAGGLKARFLANMSHEIRTPMNAIIGMTRLLLDTPLAGEQREFAEAIWNSSYALLALINDILEISKLSSGKVALRSVEFSPTSVVEGVVEMFAEKMRTKDVRLASFVDGDVPALMRGDPGRLRQVLVNLVGNAGKFTERGEITIELALESETATSSVLRFAVSDTGLGISLEAQDKLCSPFYQADDSTTRRHGGTGLGLAISAQIVEFMGGKIQVESAPGAGASFRFTVELERGPEKPKAEAELRASLKGTRVLYRRGARPRRALHASSARELGPYLRFSRLRRGCAYDAIASSSRACAVCTGDPRC
jgi:signal transduction histidine kinase